MRKFNIVTKQSRAKSLLDCHYLNPAPLYQSEEGETTDISLALKTPYGVPIQIGYSKDLFTPHSCYNEKPSITFNPLIPHAREIAIQARLSLNDTIVDSTIYMDKLEAMQYSNNCISAFASRFKELLNSKPNEQKK